MGVLQVPTSGGRKPVVDVEAEAGSAPGPLAEIASSLKPAPRSNEMVGGGAGVGGGGGEVPAFMGMRNQGASSTDPDADALKGVFEQIDAEHAAAFKGQLRRVSVYDPDAIAKKYNMRLRAGVPISGVTRDLNGAAERLSAAETFSHEQITQMRQDRPAFIRRVMEDPAFAAMVQDDVEHTGKLEGLWPAAEAEHPAGAFSKLLQGIYGAATGGARATMGAVHEFAKNPELPTGSDLNNAFTRGSIQWTTAHYGQRQISDGLTKGTLDPRDADILDNLEQQVSEDYASSNPDRGFLSGAPEAIVEQLPTLAAIGGAVGIGAISGGPYGAAGVGLGMTGYLEAGSAMAEFSRLKDADGNPVDPKMAATFAVGVGVMNGALEIVGQASVLKALPGAGALKKRFAGAELRSKMKKLLTNPTARERIWKAIGPQVTALVTEGSTEGLQEIVTILGGELAAEGDLGEAFTAENLARVADAAKGGAQVGFGLGGIGTVTRGAGQVRERRAERPSIADDLAGKNGAQGNDGIDTSVDPVTGKPLGPDRSPAVPAPVAGDETDSLAAAGKALFQEVQEVEAAKRDGHFIEALGDWASKGLLTKRSPELTAEFVDESLRRVVGGGLENLRVAPGVVREMVEAKPEMAAAFRRAAPDFDTQLEQATKVGGDVLIPTGAYAAWIAPQYHETLREHLKLRPGALTMAEVNDVDAGMQAEVQRLMAQAHAETGRQREADDLYSELTASIEADIRVAGNAAAKKGAQSGAAMLVAMESNLARLAGMGLKEYHEAHGPRIVAGSAKRPDGSPAVPGAAQLDQSVDSGGKMGGSEGPSMTPEEVIAAARVDAEGYAQNTRASAMEAVEEAAALSKTDPTITAIDPSDGNPYLLNIGARAWLDKGTREDREQLIREDHEIVESDRLRGSVERAVATAQKTIEASEDLEVVDEITGKDSNYLHVMRRGDEDERTIKVRISDHQETTDTRGRPMGGFKIESAEGGRHEAADISIVVGEGDAIDAEKFIALVRKRLAQKIGDANPPVAPSDGEVSGGADVLYQADGNEGKQGSDEGPTATPEGGPDGSPAVPGAAVPAGKEARGFFLPVENVVGLTPKANLSTFVHELGHYYLFALSKIDHADAKADVAAVLKWVGAESFETMTPAQHEMFANGWLKYLADGKVPEGAGAQVVRAFRNFRDWLVKLVGTGRLQAIEGIELSDEVRWVFDRMIVSDAAVEEARHEAGARALLIGRNEFAMTAAEYADYLKKADGVRESARSRLTRRIIRHANRQATAEWKERLEKMKAEVREEVDATPAAGVRRFLTDKAEAHKLDEKETRAVLLKMPEGKKLAKQLPVGEHAMTAKAGGLEPQLVAEMFGYRSAEAMLREVVPLTKAEVERRVNEEAKKRMEISDDPYPGETLSKQATDALMNKRFEAVLLIEIEAAERVTGKRRLPVEALRAYAEGHLNEHSLSSIRPDENVREMRRQQNLAAKALQKGDYDGFADARRVQLAQYYIYRQARAAEREVNNTLRAIRRYDRKGLRTKLGNIYTDQIDALRVKYHLSEKRLANGMMPLSEFMAAEMQKNKPVDIAEFILEDPGRNYRTLTLGGFRQLYESLRNLEALGVWERESRVAGERIVIEEMQHKLVESIPKYTKPQERDKSGKREFAEKQKKDLRGLAASLRRIEALARTLDGGKTDGPVWTYIIKPVQRAMSHYRELEKDAIGELGKILGQHEKADWTRMVEGATFEKWFMVACNRGNDGNWGRALETAAAGEIPGVSDKTLEAKLDAIMEKRDWDAVQAIWKLNEKYRPLLEELEVRTRGFKPRWIEAQPFQTRHGKYEGGYFRIMYDPATSLKAEQREADMMSPEEMQKIGWTSPMKTRDGMVQERSGSGGQTLLLDLSVVGRSLSEVLFRVSHQDVAMHLGRVLRDPVIGGLLKRYLTDGDWSEMQRWARRVVRIREAKPGRLDPVARHMRMGIAVAGLGFNPTVAMMQLTGWMHTIPYLGYEYTAKGMQRYAASVAKGTLVEDLQDIKDRSEFMRSRAETFNVELNDLRQRLTKGSRLNRWMAANFMLIQKVQAFPDLVTWWGAYEKATDAGMEDAAAVLQADRAVRETQGSGSIADASGIESESALLKALIPFYSYYNVKWNLLLNSGSKFMRDVKGEHPVKAFAAFASDLLMLTFLEAQLSALLTNRPDDDDDWSLWALKNQITGLLGMFPIVREIPAMVGWGGSGGGAIGRVEADIAKVYKEVAQGEADLPAVKAVLSAGNYVSPVHYPSGTINRIFQGMKDFDAREAESGTALAVAGLVMPMKKPKKVAEGVYME